MGGFDPILQAPDAEACGFEVDLFPSQVDQFSRP
jgi:hypothetical protein